MKAAILFLLLFVAVFPLNAQTNASLVDDSSTTKLERVYPNPIEDYIVVEVTAANYNQATIVLMDILGNVVQRWENQELSPGTQQIRLSLRNLHSGIYLLKVVVDNKSFVQRLRKV